MHAFSSPFPLAVLLAASISCSGGTPTIPTLPTAQLTGEWYGFVDIGYVHPLSGEFVREICNHRWTVKVQDGLAFSGVFRADGGSSRFPRGEECLQEGVFTGSVSVTTITQLTYDRALGGESVNRDCTVKSSPTFNGQTSELNLEGRASDTIECLAAGEPVTVARTLLLRLYRQQ